MSKKRLSKSARVVKKNPGSRVSHEVEDGFVITIRELTRGMDPSCVGKTRRGYINNSAIHLKKRALKWIDGFPKKINGAPTGFTRVVRDVYKAIMWSHLMDRGYSVFSYDGLSDTARCDPSTARAAVNFLRKHGLTQWKTGKGWGRKNRRSLANQYVANFWPFINPETGTLHDPPYQMAPYEWEFTAQVFRSKSAKKKGGHAENQHMVSKRGKGSSGVSKKKRGHAENQQGVKGKKRRTSARPYAENQQLYSDNGIGAKNAAPTACADATANGSAARPSEESNRRKTGCIQISTLALYVDMTFDGLIELFDGKGSVQDIETVDAFCKREIFNPMSEILQKNLPSDVGVYGHVVIYGDEGRVDYVETGYSTLVLKKKPGSKRKPLGPDNWLVLDYRVSESYQTEVQAKVAALRVGI